MSKEFKVLDPTSVQPILELYAATQAEGSRAGYPTIVVRTSGCSHRCYFGEGGWCDSWYTSIHPEKGQYTLQDVYDMYKKNPHVKEMMLTGGSPTLHMDLVNTLCNFCHENDIFLTIETEGSFPVETEQPVHLLSFSPKFENSVPVLGIETPKGQIVDQKFIDQHNKFRKNIPAIAASILRNQDFHIKPVIDKDLKVLLEVEQFLEDLAQELVKQVYQFYPVDVENVGKEDFLEQVRREIKNKVWMMPAGDNREALLESYGPVMNLVRDKGYRFTGRPHIIGFDRARFV